MKRVVSLGALLVACAPEQATDQNPSTSIAATSDPSADATVTEGVADTGPGDPGCSPWMDAELGWQRDGGDDLPAAGGLAHVAVAPDGGVVVAATDDTEDESDVAIVQLDASGEAVWTLRYEGMAGLTDEALDVAAAPDGSIYVAVREQTLELISEGFGNSYEHTLVVLAIEPSGARRWRYERVVPEPEYNDNARAAGLAVTDDGYVIVVDADATSEEIAPPRLLELDRFGNEIASVDLDATLVDARLVDIDVTSSGAVLVVAARYGGSWIARVQRDGAIAWVDDDDPGNVIATAVAAGEDDEAYVLVQTGDPEAGDGGFALRRYAPDGAIAWTFEQQWPSGNGYPADVVSDCDGAPLVVGEVQSDADRFGWVGRISPYGELGWSRTLTGARPISPRSAALGRDGTFVVGGLEGVDELGPWVTRLDAP